MAVVAAVVIVGVVGLGAWAVAGNDGDGGAESEGRTGMGSDLTTDEPTPEQVDAALQFGFLELPAGAEVRRLVFRDAVDEQYRLLVALPPGGEEELLRQSDFIATFAATPYPNDYTVPGAEIPDDAAAVVAGDSVGSGGTQLVSREILVDRSNPDLTMLHITANGN